MWNAFEGFTKSVMLNATLIQMLDIANMASGWTETSRIRNWTSSSANCLRYTYKSIERKKIVFDYAYLLFIWNMIYYDFQNNDWLLDLHIGNKHTKQNVMK